MTEIATLSTELAFYAAHEAALFPIPYGKKEPFGIVASFAHDWSRDPQQWLAWQREHRCNFGLVAGPSRLVIVDVDVSEVGRETAWHYWSEWCSSHGLPTYAATGQSARGGWHILFSLPADLDISTLRQCPLVGKVEGVSKKAIIDLRVGSGFVVAAGSYYDGTAKGEQSGPYMLFPDAKVHSAPPALLAACARNIPKTASIPTGTRDATDVASLISWLTERGEFAGHDQWVSIGMALKLEFGDPGLDIWRLTHDSTVTESVETSKWNSFATDPAPGCVTLNSFLKRAHAAGWKGTVRPSTSHLFSEVAQLAANSGAKLSGAVPMTAARGAAHERLFSPVLAAVPTLPRTAEHPEMPDTGHPLRALVNAAIPAICASPSEHVIAHAVINLIHPQTAAKVWPVTPLVAARTAALEMEEVRALAPNDWAKDERGKVQNDNLDNVEFYLASLGIDTRWNDWLERVEIKGWKWSRWTRLDDRVAVQLRMHATKTGTRFVMGKEFAADALLELSSRNVVDPALQLLDKWQAAWDGEARLDTWLCRACGVPDNAYYRAVSRTVLLGLVGRIRHPGIKFDLMMVLVSAKQGTEKSSLAKVLALKNEWFIENISLGQDAKELVLLLAGKTVAEVTEMRSRGDAEAAKAMISTTHDEGRTAYGRFTTVRARRNILIGSTNRAAFLEDTSGGRRFLPVHVVGTIDLAWVRTNLPQLIGEAAAALEEEVAKHQGEKIELPPEVWAIAAEYQEAARQQSPVEEACREWFAEREDCYVLPVDIRRALEMSRLKATAPYGVHMRTLGWHQVQANTRGRDRVWVRGKKALGEMASLEPIQTAVNGRVEMRVRPGSLR